MDEEARRKLSNERDKFTRRVVSSHHLKKLIVAGPGTGKTYTFSKILEQKEGTCLVLTFVNNLVAELTEELGENACVYTFHGFCTKLLYEIGLDGIGHDFVVFPALNCIIQSDAKLLINEKPNFAGLFRELDLTTENHKFFLKRSNYYKTVSFSDSVFRVLEYLYENLEEVPTYPQILVDEYQDFNKLEVSLLDLLSERNPILIVGDDDQALYGNIRSASPKYIRDKHYDYRYKNFKLPFCSRCTQVVINAMKDIVGRAQDNKKLSERIEKSYRCFTPAKEEDNSRFPRIAHVHCTVQRKNAPYIPKFIKQEISSLNQSQITQIEAGDSYPVLVAGPHRYLKMVDDYFGSRDGFHVHYESKKEKKKSEDISLISGN